MFDSTLVKSNVIGLFEFYLYYCVTRDKSRLRSLDLYKSIRNCVDYICVVYQETSNFGMKCSDTLMASLTALHAQGLADELVLYTPRSFSFSEKKKLISSKATGLDLGGATPATISDTFFNELTKMHEIHF